MITATKRCLIREFEEKDLDPLMLYRNNDEWMKYQGFKNMSKQVYRERLIIAIDLNVGAQLAIIKKDTEQLIGDLYLKQQNEQCYLGYAINPLYARNGYIQEVIVGIIPWLQAKGIHQLKAEVDVHNVASINLLKKLNFVYQDVNTDQDKLYCLNIK